MNLILLILQLSATWIASSLAEDAPCGASQTNATSLSPLPLNSLVKRQNLLAPSTFSVWPLKSFAPYVDIVSWTSLNLASVASTQGFRHSILSFVVADSNNQPSWGGQIPMSQNYFATQIREYRIRNGNNVIMSFGGPAGKELAQVINSPCDLAQSYLSVIDRYNITWIDFWIDGSALTDKASIDVRNKALRALKDRNPRLRISYSLPTIPNGLREESLYVIESALAHGVSLNVVNLLTMNYGLANAPNLNNMGAYAIQAARTAYTQCQQMGLTSFGIGITPMIGVNVITSERFTQANAQELLKFARETSYIRLLSFWSLRRDNGSKGPLFQSSQLDQKDFEFTNILKGVDPVNMRPSRPSPVPVSPPAPRPTTTAASPAISSTRPSIAVSSTFSSVIASPRPSVAPPPPSNAFPWTNKIFAPYVNTWANVESSMTRATNNAGVKYFTIAFVVADTRGEPAINGWIPMSNNYLGSYINGLRAKGGDVIMSFGGAGGNEVAVITNNVNTLQAKYQSVVDQYKLTWLDFDIEGSALDNMAANDRRNQALSALQKANKNVKIAYTLPVVTSGLLSNSMNLLRSANRFGLRVDLVNIMTMSMGISNGATGMGDANVQAAQNLRRQLVGLGMTNTLVGLTPMIGQNDIPSEYFRIEDARQVLNFANANSWVGLISFWSLQRDNNVKTSNLDSSSNYAQEDLAFSKVFVQYK